MTVATAEGMADEYEQPACLNCGGDLPDHALMGLGEGRDRDSLCPIDPMRPHQGYSTTTYDPLEDDMKYLICSTNANTPGEALDRLNEITEITDGRLELLTPGTGILETATPVDITILERLELEVTPWAA